MATEFSVRGDVKALSRRLDDFAAKQLPYATALAINAVAAKVKAAEAENMRRRLDRPSPFTINSLSVRKANKSTLSATVFVKDIAARYLLPSEQQTSQLLPGSSRAMLRPAQPAQINRYGNLPRGRVAQLAGRPDVFVGVVQTVNGPVDGVWQRPAPALKGRKGKRKGKPKTLRGANKSGHLKLLVRFADPVPVKTQLNYGTTAEEMIRREMPAEMDKAINKAISTAK